MKNTIKIMAAILMLVFTMGLTTATTAEAASKFDEVETLKVTSGETKIVTTSKKIKKVKIISKNKNFKVKKTGSYQYTVSGTDKGKTQTIKVTYKDKHAERNKYTVKVKIKTVALKGYKKKVIKELKTLMADPDKGLQTALAQWDAKLGTPSAKYKNVFKVFNGADGKTVTTTTDDGIEHAVSNNKTVSILTMDEVMKQYTASQKKALILEAYCRTRMTYGLQGHNRKKSYFYNRGRDSFFKLLYKGKFWGLCEEGAAMSYDICQFLGLKANYISCHGMNHAWTCIYVTDKNGTSYWHGIYATAQGYNLKKSAPTDKDSGGRTNLTKKQVKKYLCQPNQRTWFIVMKERITTPTPKPAATATPDTTETSAPTASLTITEPIKDTDGNILVMPSVGYICPGCSPLNPPPVRHTDNINPYITNSKTAYKDYAVYQHVIGIEIRYFDENGNEYFDVNSNGTIMDELIGVAG